MLENFPGELLFVAPKARKTKVVINSSTINVQHVTVDIYYHYHAADTIHSVTTGNAITPKHV